MDKRYLCALVILATAASGCGKFGASTGAAAKPLPTAAETETDREAKRLKAAREIVPERSQCLPPIMRKSSGPRLELAVIGKEPIACAIDTDRERLLGPIACFKLDLVSGALQYREPAPLPGVGFSVLPDGRCVRGYCLPSSSAIPASTIARIAYDLEGARVAVLVGGEMHLFDTKSRKRIGGFAVGGKGGVEGELVAVHFVGETIFVASGTKQTPTPGAVWVFKSDGTSLGAIQTPENTPASTVNGALLVLDGTRVAVAEQGWASVIVYEVDSGKRTRTTRALPRSPCTSEQTKAFWEDDDDVTIDEPCQAYVDKMFAPLIGASGVAGSKNWLVALRGSRSGTLAIVDGSLTEKRVIDLPWCESNAKPNAERE